MLRKMFLIGLMVAVFSMLAPRLGMAAETVLIPFVVELSGSGAPVGVKFDRGGQMAIEEINAKGGILKRKIETFSLDNKSEPPVAVAQMKKAIERKPFAVFGSVYSACTLVNMAITQQAEIPQFTGSEAPDITKKGNP